MANITIQSLFVYPIKSLRGISLSVSAVERRGLRYDRRWMLVDEGGSFLTQRTHAPMATVGMRLTDHGLIAYKEGLGEIEIPSEAGNETVKVKVWSFEGKARLVDKAVDAWFTEAIGIPCRLVKMPETTKRSIHPHYGHGEIAFSDAMPVLVASQASLDLLNSKLESPLPMNRFRANVILGGSEAHEEDAWSSMQIGNVTMRRTKKCGRCLVTTTDQETGIRGTEPLRTLATYRQEGQVVYFGCYYVPESLGEIKIGDPVQVNPA